MIQFYEANKVLLGLIGGTLVALAPLLKCFFDLWTEVDTDFASKLSVVENLLDGKFVDELTAHHTSVSEEIKKGIEVKDLCSRPEYRNIVKSLASHMEKRARVRFLYKYTQRAIRATVWALWALMILALLPLISTLAAIPRAVLHLWIAILIVDFLCLLLAVTLYLVFRSKYLTGANNVISPEPDSNEEP